MKKLLSFACSLLLAAVLCTNAQAQFMQNWSIDPDGAAGSSSALAVKEYVNVQGSTYLEMTSTGGFNFNFNNLGVLQFTGVQGKANASMFGITGIYNLAGYGTLGSSIAFTAGTLDLYYDANNNYGETDGFYGVTDGAKIATLSLSTGSALIDSAGLPNGKVSLSYTFDNIVAGYLFGNSGDDLSDLMNDYVLKAFSTTNFSVLEDEDALLQAELGQYASSLGITLGSGTFFKTQAAADGQVRLAPVPEPATVMLMGAGFLGLALIGRKKIVK